MLSPPIGKPDNVDSPRSEPAVEAAGARIAIDFEHARGQHLRWLLIGGIIGTLCVIGLGTLGQVIGAILVAYGAWNGFQFVRTLLHPAGTVIVDGDKVELPRGLCHGSPQKLHKADITAAYFLRRAVPWTYAGPVLVIEAGGRAFAYPRDWFVGESDQRRLIEALAPQ
jgi:hypothetical protein